MFGSIVLEVAIGVVFVYLLLSLIVTAVTELISSWLRLRSTNLWDGIRNLLDSDGATQWAAKLYDHPLIQGLSPLPPKAPKKPATAARVVGPSYIPSRTFAVALLDVLKESTTSAQNPDPWLQLQATIQELPDKKLKRLLVALLGESRGDLELFKKNLEIWFNNTMERVSGWYKRTTQKIHIVLAVAVTLAINVDSVLVVNALSQNQALRDSVVAEAQAYAKQEPNGATSVKPASSPAQTPSPASSPAPAATPTTPAAETPAPNPTQQTSTTNPRTAAGSIKDIERLQTKLSSLDLPVGWILPGQRNYEPTNKDFRLWPGIRSHHRNASQWWDAWWNTIRFHFFGWLLTAFAISLGAPFWFDMLNKVINIRSSGASPEEQPKSPQKVPQPREPGQVPTAQ
ncbi:MAG TPA: hypothetical protein VGS07_28515 [Thermoanaerobaculia bacterium]|jgi:hypothetical protein|nr:hypothetical protein [Thermoanaerobaculia bacterium]